MDDAIQIYYSAFTSLSSSATFMNARNACISAAQAYPMAVREAVTNAWAAVGVGGEFNNNLPAPTLNVLMNCNFGNLYWNAIPGATQYKVYRGLSTNPASATHFRTTGSTNLGILVNSNTVYKYWVKACDTSVCSTFSNRVTPRVQNGILFCP